MMMLFRLNHDSRDERIETMKNRSVVRMPGIKRENHSSVYFVILFPYTSRESPAQILFFFLPAPDFRLLNSVFSAIYPHKTTESHC